MSEHNPAGVPPDSSASGVPGAARTEAPLTAQQASQQLAQLRQDRIDGKVGQKAYFERMEYLSKVESGELVTPPRLKPPTEFEQLQRQAEDFMAPPKDADGYGILVSGEEDAALDAGVRKGFLAVEMPLQYARPIVESLIKMGERLENAPDDVIESEVRAAAARLRSMWGDKFDANAKAVNELMVEIFAADPALADEYEDLSGAVVMDPLAMDLLLRTAEARARRRATGRRTA